MDEGHLQEAEGCGGGLQRKGEAPVGVSAADLAELENASIHVNLVLMVVYAVCSTAYGIEKPELMQTVAYFA